VIPALLALFRQLATRHEVHVFALHQEPEPGRWELAGAIIHNIGVDPLAWRVLREILREHRRAPFALVQSIWSGRCGVVALLAARLLRRPCPVHVAGGELVALSDIGYGGLLSLRHRISESQVLRRADVVSAASAPMIASLDRLGIRAEVVPLGVDLASWPARPPQRRDSRALRLIQIASLNRVKDQPTLLRAVARLRAMGVPISLQIVGEDTLDGKMQRLAAELGVDTCVRFSGYLPHRLLRAEVEASDLCIVSSRHEAGPLALLEAAIAGVPTVGTAVGYVVEWSPQAARAVSVGDDEVLADTIRRLAEDEDARLALAKAAQARALAMDSRYAATRFCELYEKQMRRA
jgi:glycosyltransferase involved in cell wall biosynthesis